VATQQQFRAAAGSRLRYRLGIGVATHHDRLRAGGGESPHLRGDGDGDVTVEVEVEVEVEHRYVDGECRIGEQSDPRRLADDHVQVGCSRGEVSGDSVDDQSTIATLTSAGFDPTVWRATIPLNNLTGRCRQQTVLSVRIANMKKSRLVSVRTRADASVVIRRVRLR
jgi:hypothetical protein